MVRDGGLGLPGRSRGIPGAVSTRPEPVARAGLRRSLWFDGVPETGYPVARGRLTADVAVVGAGITGLLAAYALVRAGAEVAVVEGRRGGSGATGPTSAKLSPPHRLPYDGPARRPGHQRAAPPRAAKGPGTPRHP